MMMLLSTEVQGAKESMDQFRMGQFRSLVLPTLRCLVQPSHVKPYDFDLSKVKEQPEEQHCEFDLIKAQEQLYDAFFPVLTKFFTIESIKKECIKNQFAFHLESIRLDPPQEVPQKFLNTKIQFFLDNFNSKFGILLFISLMNEKALLSKFAFFGENDKAFYCICCDFDQNTQSLQVNSSYLVTIDSVLPKKSNFMRNILIISGLLVVGSIFSFVIYRKYKS